MSDDPGVESAYRVGDLYWKKDNDGSKDWVLVKLINFDSAKMNGMCALIDERTGSRMPNQTVQLDFNTMTICPANPLFTTYPDMTSLRYLHEAALVKNLYDRWIPDDRQPYTSMSNVLIAVNPLRYLKKLEKKMFVSQSLDKSPPHPYNVAENAYRQLRSVKQNQSIIISGESGSGKTETSKIILDFLTERSSFTGGSAAKLSRSTSNQDEEIREHEHALGERLMETIPILESFGNAKTHRNHNSSRFGKYMRLQFSPDEDIRSTALHLTGASIDTYLLETSRVVHPPEGERNFHVFYEVLRSGDAPLLEELKLVPNPYVKSKFGSSNSEEWMDQYHYLNRSGCTASDFIDDRANFQLLKSALNFAGIDPNELFRIVAGVLHLGNLNFDEEDTSEGMTAIIHRENDKEACIDIIADMLGLKLDDLIDALLKKKIERTKGSFQRRGSVYFVGKTVQQASYSRDTVAKMIYDQVFSSLMLQCADILEYNLAMKDELPYIGVLDIFGFEDFEPKNRNSFEQLLINYANEALQSMFNQCILKAEQELYQAENIWAPQDASLLFPFLPQPSDEPLVVQQRIESGKPISYDDNRECLSLITDRRDGVLAILNTVGRLAGPSDRKLNERLHTTFKKHPCFVLPHPRDAQHTFCIKHYAGIVRYRIDGFIDKNNNVASSQFKELISGSTLKLLNASPFDGASKTPPGSVSEMFSHQMKGLVLELDSTRNNFIRCIKPNPAMDAKIFDRSSVLDQLRCSGTIQACQVLQVGLPTRVSYEELVFIYSDLLGTPFMQRFRDNDRLFTQALCQVLDFPTDAFRLGDTRLFFKTGKIHLLDTVLAVTPAFPPVELKSRLVSYLAKQRWISATTKVIVLRTCEKIFLNCRKGRRAIVLQCWFRQILARKRVEKIRAENRASKKWNSLLSKLQIRSAFDRSVEDKLTLLQVLLRHKNLKANGKWLLTWLGPLQRAMYVRKLGRAACIAYLAKRAFTALLDKVRRERACVKIQSQIRRVLATEYVKKIRQQSRARAHWDLIRIVTKVNICFMAMYRRAHVFELERDVTRLNDENSQLSEQNLKLLERIGTLEAVKFTWDQKQSEFQAMAESFAMEKSIFEEEISTRNIKITHLTSQIEDLQVRLRISQNNGEVQAVKCSRLEETNKALSESRRILEENLSSLEKQLSSSLENYRSFETENMLQNNQLKDQVDAMQNRINDTKHELRLKTVQVSELEEYNTELKDENESLLRRMDEMEQLHEQTLSNHARESSSKISELTAQVETLQAHLQKSAEDHDQKSKALADLETALLAQKSQNMQLSMDLNRINSESSHKINSLDTEITNARSEISHLNFELNRLQADLDAANSHIELKSNKISELETIKDQYREKGSQLMEKMVQLEKTLAASKEEELTQALQAQQEDHNQQVASLNSQLKTLHLQYKQAQVEIEIHSAAVKEFDNFRQLLKEDNMTLKQKVESLAAALMESKDKEVALDTKLTDSNIEISKLQSQLQYTGLNLKDKLAELERAENALDAKSATVELEKMCGQLTEVHTSLTTELQSLKLSQIAAKQTEEELDDQLAESSRRAVVLGAQLKQMQLQLDQVHEHIAVKDAVVMAEETMKLQLKVDNEVLYEKVDASQKAIAEVRNKELELASQLSDSNREISTLLSKLESVKLQFDIANSHIKEQAKVISDYEGMISELKEKSLDLQIKVTHLEMALAESRAKERTLGSHVANTSDHISSLTTQLGNVQRQFSEVNEQAEIKTAEAKVFETFKNQLKLDNMTLTEKMESLIHHLSESKQQETKMEVQLAESRKQVLAFELQTESANLKLEQTEAQLEATLTNALELKSKASELSLENQSLAEEIALLRTKVEDLQRKEVDFKLQLDENSHQMLVLHAQAAQTQIQLEQAQEEMNVKAAVIMAVEAMNAKLKEDLASAMSRLKDANATIFNMKLTEEELGHRIADSNDHIYALQTQLTQLMTKFDVEIDSSADMKLASTPDGVNNISNESKQVQRANDPIMPYRSDLVNQLKSTAPIISNNIQALTPITNSTDLLSNVQTVFISVTPEDSGYSQNSRQELEARIDGNNNKVAALEAQLKLLEMKQEHFLQEARANESIEKLRATIAEKDDLIAELRKQLRKEELGIRSPLSPVYSSSGGEAKVMLPVVTTSAPTNATSKGTARDPDVFKPIVQLEAEVKQQQDLMRRVRKVVLQSRWGQQQLTTSEPEEPPEPTDSHMISRAFTSYDSCVSFEDV
ncbi:hypothetical protein Ae201684P_008247 [Aphanomyces euteiches]|nr:hypothetical protein Ae201684P_008247 [Aphanomyces euteiches]